MFPLNSAGCLDVQGRNRWSFRYPVSILTNKVNTSNGLSHTKQSNTLPLLSATFYIKVSPLFWFSINDRIWEARLEEGTIIPCYQHGFRVSFLNMAIGKQSVVSRFYIVSGLLQYTNLVHRVCMLKYEFNCTT